MKCEKCGNAEATYHYRANINGDITERHLCSECAREEGLASAMGWQPRSTFSDPFAGMFGPYRQMPPMFQGFFNERPRRMFMPMFVPVFDRDYEPEVAAPEEAEAKIPQYAGDEMKMKREIAALRNQMNEAVSDEDFEKAAELRDKIKELMA